MSTSALVAELRANGWTKYGLAKALGVTWNTIHLWERGEHEATESSSEKLEALIKDVRQKSG